MSAKHHVQHLDTSKRDADAALIRLHAVLKARSAPRPGSFSALDDAGRREYYRLARRHSRAKERDAAAAGAIKPTMANVRAVLADAALMLLAADGPGAKEKREFNVYALEPGVASLRSVSLTNKVRITRDIQFERQRRQVMSYWQGYIEGWWD